MDLQAAYTAFQAFQALCAGASEDAARLKEKVHALLLECAQHAKAAPVLLPFGMSCR